MRHAVAVLHVGAGRARRGGRLPEEAAGDLDAVLLRRHGVVAHLRVRLGAQHPGVHEREVRHIEEVLDDAGSAGVHDLRLVVVLTDAGHVPLREVGRWLLGCAAERHEDHAVALAHVEHREAGVRRWCEIGRRRLADALAAAVVDPAVVGAHEGLTPDLPEGQRRAAVGTLVAGRVEGAVRGAPEHERRVEQRHAQRSIRRDVPSVRHRHPTVEQHRVAHGAHHRRCAAPALSALACAP